MGTYKIRKRVPLWKQFTWTFIWIFIASLLTSILIIAALSHNIAGNPPLSYIDQQMLTRLETHLHSNPHAVLNPRFKTTLETIIRNDVSCYYILNKDHIVIYGAAKSISNHDRLIKWFPHHKTEFHHTSNLYLPIGDMNSNELLGTLVLVLDKNKTRSFFIISELLIPFISLIVFTLVFAGLLSQRLRRPLKNLMDAAAKIRDRDLDFTIKTDQANEIGDLAEALEEMRSELKDTLVRGWKLEQDRREMVSALTHDLRTPLTIIQGYVEGLEDGLKADPKKLDAYLLTIRQNASRMNKLLDEMNALAEVDSVEFELKKRRIDFKEWMHQKTREIKLLASKKAIHILLEIIDERPEDLPLCLDPDRLAQVIENIVGNSIRWTPEGGTIRISTHLNEKQLTLTIADNGPGFAHSDLHHLFKKFYKGDASRSLEKGHSGLGLYIAKAIIEKFGGTIQANNLPQGGARVLFTIPIEQIQ